MHLKVAALIDASTAGAGTTGVGMWNNISGRSIKVRSEEKALKINRP
jgi:hypothetical protein